MRSLLALLATALCICGSFAVVQVPIRRTVVPSLHTSEGSVVEYLTVEVSVGTPAQRFNLTLDFGFYYAYLFDAKARQVGCKLSPSSRNRFHRTKSITYRRETDDFTTLDLARDVYFEYCLGGAVQPIGAVGKDVLSIGSLTSKANVAIVDILVNQTIQPFWPSDGVLGFVHFNNSVLPADLPKPSTIVDLASAAGSTIVSIYLGNDAKNVPGALTLGDVDLDNCDGYWTRFPLFDAKDNIDNWNVRVDGVQFEKPLKPGKQLVALVDSRSRTRVPRDIFSTTVSRTGAEYDFASDEYVVPCNKVEDLTDFVLNLEGRFKYTVPATAYAKNLVPRNDKKCTLLIEEDLRPPSSSPVQTISLGWPALKPYCVMFDYANAVVAFATPLQKK